MTYLLLFLSVFLSAAAAYSLRLEDRVKIRLLTAFGGAYVFTITILHLLPEVFREGKPGISGFILTGFFIQVFLEYFSHGIEHGHAHHEHKHGIVPMGIILGLCVHSFLEGMPLGSAGMGFPAEHAHRMLLAGIIMHNIPVSVVLVSMLRHDELPPVKIWMLMIAFALMSPLGALTSTFSKALMAYETQLAALVIGIFLHLSTTILFEASEAHRINRQKIVGIIIGAVLAILTASFH
jgi:zinc and cadmium transporter